MQISHADEKTPRLSATAKIMCDMCQQQVGLLQKQKRESLLDFTV